LSLQPTTVDPSIEMLLASRLAEFTPDQTRLLVSHRPEALRSADCRMVLAPSDPFRDEAKPVPGSRELQAL